MTWATLSLSSSFIPQFVTSQCTPAPLVSFLFIIIHLLLPSLSLPTFKGSSSSSSFRLRPTVVWYRVVVGSSMRKTVKAFSFRKLGKKENERRGMPFNCLVPAVTFRIPSGFSSFLFEILPPVFSRSWLQPVDSTTLGHFCSFSFFLSSHFYYSFVLERKQKKKEEIVIMLSNNWNFLRMCKLWSKKGSLPSFYALRDVSLGLALPPPPPLLCAVYYLKINILVPGIACLSVSLSAWASSSFHPAKSRPVPPAYYYSLVMRITRIRRTVLARSLLYHQAPEGGGVTDGNHLVSRRRKRRRTCHIDRERESES